MMQRPPGNFPRLTHGSFLVMLFGGAWLSATASGVEITLGAQGEFALLPASVYPVAIIILAVSVADLCGESAATKGRSQQKMSVLFSITVGGVSALVIANPSGILGGYRLSAWTIMILASILTIWSGAKLGAYYGFYGAPHKILRRKAALILLIGASAFAYVCVRSAIGGQPEEHQSLWHLSAVVALAFKVVLLAEFGAGHAADKKPNQRRRSPEFAWWLLLYGVALLIASLYAACDFFIYNGAVMQYAVSGLSAVMILVGAALSSRISSLKPRQGGKPWFGYAVLALVCILSVVDAATSLPSAGQCPGMCQSLTLALIPPTVGLLGAMLGAHISARLKQLVGSYWHAVVIRCGECGTVMGAGQRGK